MANVPRSYVVNDVFQGPVDVYDSITAPASSLTPTADANTLLLDSLGQPTAAAGNHLGSVEGPTTIVITEKVNEILDDQHESPIDVAFDTVEAEIDITVKETNLSRLQRLMTSSGLSAYNALAATQAWQIGGQFDSSRSAVSILLVSPDRTAAGKFIYALAYKTYLNAAIKMDLHRTKEVVYKLKFRAIMDLTRVQGDELLQIVRTK